MRKTYVRRTAFAVAVAMVASSLHGAPADARVSAAHRTTGLATATAPTPITGGTIQLDNETHGFLDGAGDIDTWTFNAPSAVTIVPRVLIGSDDDEAFWRLTDRDGRTLFRSFLSQEQVPVVLTPALSPYTLNVSDASGRYLFVCPDHTLGTCTTPAREYSFGFYARGADTFPIVLNGTAGGSVSIPSDPASLAPTRGRIDSAGATDVYTFAVAAGGMKLFFDANLGATTRRWVLTDANRTYFDTSAEEQGPLFLPQGNYRLTVYAVVGVISPAWTYTATIWTVPAPPAILPALAVNGSVTIGNTVPGAVDVYSFTGVKDTKVSILFEDDLGSGAANDCAGNTQFVLRLPNGVLLPKLDEGIIKLPEDGRYELTVQRHPSDIRSTLRYCLRAGPSTAAENVAIPSRPEAVASLGTMDGTNTLAGSGNIAPAGSADAYTFNATAGMRSFFTGTAPSSSFKWRLHGPDGRVYPAFDTAIGSFGEVNFLTSGTYTLVAYTTGTATGAYDFTISPMRDDSFALTGLTTPLSEGELTVPTNVSAPPNTTAGMIDKPGVQDVYRFYGEAGTRIYLKSLSTPPGVIAQWNLRSPATTLVEPLDAAVTFSDLGAVALPYSGIYTLAVKMSGNSTGSYSFTIARVPVTVVRCLGDTSKCPDDTTRVGPTVAGNIAKPGERDLYRFWGTAGERVFLKSLDGTASSLRWTLYDPDGKVHRWAVAGSSTRVSSHLGVYRIAYSGWYEIDVGGSTEFVRSATGPYAFTVERPHRERPFDLGELSSGASVTVPNSTEALAADGAGDIPVGGARDIYHFQARAGQQLSFTNLNGSTAFTAKLLAPDGAVLTGANNIPIKDRTLGQLAATTVAVDRDGQHTLVVSSGPDDASGGPNPIIGTYALRISAGGTPSTSPRTEHFHVALDKTATTATRIAPHDPFVGVGMIEGARTADIIHVEAESGDAVGITFLHTDVSARLANHGRGIYCVGSQYVDWTVRDSDGEVIQSESIGCNGVPLATTGTLVFPDAGTYTVSITGATASDSYDLTFWPIPSMDEAAKPGQEHGEPEIARVTPSTGAAGGTTTLEIYGRNLPKITALRMTGPIGTLPIELIESFRVGSSLESLAAKATVDLSQVMTATTYTLRADLADGTTLEIAQAFRALTNVIPRIEVTLEHAPLLNPATINYVFVRISNPTDADYYNGLIPIGVPCDGTSTTRQGVAYPTTVRLVGGSPNRSVPQEIASMLLQEGIAPAIVQALQDAGGDETIAPHRVAGGSCEFLSYVYTVPSRGAVVLKLEVVPPTPPPGTIGNLDRPIVTPVAEDTTVAPSVGETPENPWGDLFQPPAGFDSWEEWANQANPNASCEELLRMLTFAEGVLLVLKGLALAHLLLLPPQIHALLILLGAVVALLIALTHEFCHDDPAPGHPGKPHHPPVGDAIDPNEISGDRTVHVRDTVHYTVQFENYGPGDAAQVDMLTRLDPERFDLSTFKVEEVGVGNASTALVGNGPHSTGTLPVNDTIVNVTSTLRPHGDLNVEFAGVPNEFQPTYGNFLPANSDANRPAGQGYVRFSVALKPSVRVGTLLIQDADIIFNQHAFGGDVTPTNEWNTMVVLPGDHPITGANLKILESSRPAARKVKLKLRDDALKSFGDPRTSANGGVKVEIVSENGASRYTVPTNGWTATTGGTPSYTFRAPSTSNLPIRKLVIVPRLGMIKLDAKGSQLQQNIATQPEAVEVIISLGNERWCTTFGGRVRYRAARSYVAKNAPLAPWCTYYGDT